MSAEPTAKPTKVPKAKKTKEPEQKSDDVLRKEKVHVSHYEPALGGANCSNFVAGECASNTASGRPWKDWWNTGAACVKEWDFDTRFRLPDGRIFTCVDRGGAIRYGYTPYWMESDGLGWVDLLTDSPGYDFGTVVEVEILK